MHVHDGTQQCAGNCLCVILKTYDIKFLGQSAILAYKTVAIMLALKVNIDLTSNQWSNNIKYI